MPKPSSHPAFADAALWDPRANEIADICTVRERSGIVRSASLYEAAENHPRLHGLYLDEDPGIIHEASHVILALILNHLHGSVTFDEYQGNFDPEIFVYAFDTTLTHDDRDHLFVCHDLKNKIRKNDFINYVNIAYRTYYRHAMLMNTLQWCYDKTDACKVTPYNELRHQTNYNNERTIPALVPHMKILWRQKTTESEIIFYDLCKELKIRTRNFPAWFVIAPGQDVFYLGQDPCESKNLPKAADFKQFDMPSCQKIDTVYDHVMPVFKLLIDRASFVAQHRPELSGAKLTKEVFRAVTITEIQRAIQSVKLQPEPALRY